MFRDNSKLKNIFFVGFLLSLHLALTAYVNSSFLSLFLSEKSVGLLYTFGSIATIIALLFIPKILRRVGGYKFILWSAGLCATSLLLLSSFENILVIIPVFIFYLTLNSIIVFLLDELLEIFSKNSKVGKTRGVYLAVMSMAWVIAPSVSGATLNKFPFFVLYLMSFGIMVVFFIFAFFSLKNLPDPKYDRAPVWGSLKRFFANRNLARSYKINFILQFFFAVMVIYTPIYLNAHLLFSWSEIGTIFTIMLTPFVFMPFPVGRYSDKIGERKMLIAGFTVASLATLSLFFITKHEVWVWALLLFTTRLGASTIEIMSDVYFFKHISPESDEFIGIYRNTSPVAYILAPLVVFAIFSLTPAFNFIYLVLGALLLYGVYLASTIRKDDI